MCDSRFLFILLWLQIVVADVSYCCGLCSDGRLLILLLWLQLDVHLLLWLKIYVDIVCDRRLLILLWLQLAVHLLLWLQIDVVIADCWYYCDYSLLFIYCCDCRLLLWLQIACRQLGYNYGLKTTGPQGSGRIWLTNVRCTEKNASNSRIMLKDCYHRRLSNVRMNPHRIDVAVQCYRKLLRVNFHH